MSGLAMDICPEDELLPVWRIDSPLDMGGLLWTNSKYKDFQIMIGDRVIDVHKCVLAARSPVFLAMLTSGLTEDQLGFVVIQDFEFDTVQNVIWFLYSDRFVCNYSTPFICDLLRFGQKYDIQLLINACLNQIDYLRSSYDSSEKKYLIKSVEDLGQGSEQILNSIQIIFGVIGGDLEYYSYQAIGYELVKDDSFKDLKLICDGEEFSTHKCILTLKSPILAQIFEKMAENDTSGQLAITSFKAAIVEKAVEFFYTCWITSDEDFEDNPDLYLGLLEFADKFKVEKLVSFCLIEIDKLKENIGKEAISTWIKTARSFESEKILHFILGIFGTPGYVLNVFEFALKIDSMNSYWN